MKKPLMSGHCGNPQTDHPERSHERCKGGQSANPTKEFQPCPCPCHFEGPYECGGCGRDIALGLAIPLDEDGDEVYVHVDSNGRMIHAECA